MYLGSACFLLGPRPQRLLGPESVGVVGLVAGEARIELMTIGPVFPAGPTLMGPDGVLARGDPVLTDNLPTAVLTGELFPGVALPRDAALLVEGPEGVRLAGSSFSFNQRREPSMAKAYPVSK